MKRVLLPILVCLFLYCTALAQEARDRPQFHGQLETAIHFKHSAVDNIYSFDFPLYGKFQIVYEREMFNTVLALDYYEELSIGETYIQGGSEYSYLKIGNYTEDWGVGYAVSPISILNKNDSRYPENIFYRRYYRPNPLFDITMGSVDFYGQLAVSNREEDLLSLSDTYLGFRIVGKWSDYDMSLGFIRRAGWPPPLFFLTALRSGIDYGVWVELGWEYRRTENDIFDLVIGYRRDLSSASIVTECIVNGAHMYFYIENVYILQPIVKVGIKGFSHIPDLSYALNCAFNGFFVIDIDRGLVLEPGFFLFIGKEGQYLSPYRYENNNSIYLKLQYQF